jgi:hypothetical protein
MLATCLLAPASAGAFSKAIWGEPTVNGVDQFPLYKRLHVGILELQLQWYMVAVRKPANATDPKDPAYQWPADIADAIAEGRRYGIRILIQITDAPAWANGGHTGAGWAPLKPGDYAAFAAAAARRYPGVHLWMIWGEPVRYGNFRPFVQAVPEQPLTSAQQAAPHLYARILDAAYGALKRVSSKNLVIGGCTYTSGLDDPQQWIANLKLPDGQPPRMDMYAHNPFSYSAPVLSGPPSPFGEVQFSDLHELAGWVDRYLRKGMPLFLSEFTIPTAPDVEFNYYVNPELAAQWVTEALRVCRAWHRIDALGWVHVYDDPPLSYGGLLTAAGERKPDFAAFADG